MLEDGKRNHQREAGHGEVAQHHIHEIEEGDEAGCEHKVKQRAGQGSGQGATDGFKIGKTTLKMSLVEASDGQVGSFVDKLALRCFRFDHLEQKYSLNILLAIRVSAILMVLGLGLSVTYYVRKERRKLASGSQSSPVPTEVTS